MFTWLDPRNSTVGVSHVGGIDFTAEMDSLDLSISSVGVAHAGRYTCMVTGGGAEQTINSDLTVQCKEDTCWELCFICGCLCGEVVDEVVCQGYVYISVGWSRCTPNPYML